MSERVGCSCYTNLAEQFLTQVYLLYYSCSTVVLPYLENACAQADGGPLESGGHYCKREK